MKFLLRRAKDLRATDFPKPISGPGEVFNGMRRAGRCPRLCHAASRCTIALKIELSLVGHLLV